ncbi:hypothetical protein BRD13_07705 [Halobacteriales archaeon SW_5_70_135]|nr:MAG: hypothetical protein BRD13_07705 [Halobacteriales archaeon SW_5_70_135]
MNRRRLLEALGAATAVGLAGCTQSQSTDGGSDDSGDDAGAGGEGASPDESGEVVRGPRGEVELPVPAEEIDEVVGKNDIPAVTRPVFGPDWSDAEYDLADEDRVVGVVRAGEARAYPLPILDWHEVVNDTLGGPLLVTYCPLCGSGVTAERRVDGEETTFGVSGKLWRSDLMMYDEATESLWSQILGTAVRGPRTGDQLSLVPSTITTWGQWRTDHPETRVLLPPPDSSTIVPSAPQNYGIDPYAGYDDSDDIGVSPTNEFDDDRLHPKTRVVGVATEDAAKAYPFGRVAEVGVVDDRVGDLPVVVAAGAGETLSAFDRRVGGEALDFEPAGEDRMRAGGSTWTRSSGVAVDGPYEGSRLDDAARVSTEFWFAWLNFHPNTTVYGE